MDTSSFDRIARLLGGATSRRAGLGAAAAALLGAAAPTLAAPAAANPGSSSQCGKRVSSRCESNADCCNGRCNLEKGKLNKDGLGRCRCSRRGEQCGDDKDCCRRNNQNLACLDGVCGTPPPPCVRLGETCRHKSTCCKGTCSYAASAPPAQDRSGPPKACCLAQGESGCRTVSDCCANGADPVICEGGVCSVAIVCKELQESCVQGVDTCCAGTCANYQPRPVSERGSIDPRCCIAPDASGCLSSDDCCAAQQCLGGTCAYPN
ncbi:MAG: hypothetical protein ACKOWF_01865 [Chloroflexota bacterium]